MRTVIFVGSRDHQGRTGRAVAALDAGLREGGAEVEQVWLLERHLRMSVKRNPDGFGQCLEQGVCKLDDEFGALVEKLRAADLVVFATPVYWGEMSEILRAFIDRLRRICLHEEGKRGIAGKQAVAVCVAGGGGGGAPNSVNLMQRVLSHCELDGLDVIPARRQNLDLKLDVLRLTGRWLAGHVAPHRA
mgnify:CR=1 FL=1